MQIQKLTHSINSNKNVLFGNNTDNLKKDEIKDYEVLKASIAEGL